MIIAVVSSDPHPSSSSVDERLAGAATVFGLLGDLFGHFRREIRDLPPTKHTTQAKQAT
jgi:hypothetical protein